MKKDYTKQKVVSRLLNIKPRCPECGNIATFVEVLEDCCHETSFKKNDKGEWKRTNAEVNAESSGNLIFECGECGHDCTDQHQTFLDQYLK